MFAQYTYIATQHHVALEACIRNHSVVSGISAQLLSKMYKLALEGLTGVPKEDGLFISKLSDGNITLCAITDGKTGLYLQLSCVKGQPTNYLTVGQKWAMEQFSPAHGNVATALW